MIKIGKKTIIVSSIWLVYLIFLESFSSTASDIIKNSNFLVSLVIYLIGQPLYILMFYGIWEYGQRKGRKPWKRVVAGLLTIIAGDIPAFPRLTLSSAITDGIATTTNLGSIGIRFLEGFLPHTIAFYTWYLVIPLVLFVISAELIGLTDWWKSVKRL